MQKEINRAAKWCQDNGLIIKVTKIKAMHIRLPYLIQSNINLIFHNLECHHRRPKIRNIINDLCDTNIELVDTKYLGAYVENKFM